MNKHNDNPIKWDRLFVWMGIFMAGFLTAWGFMNLLSYLWRLLWDFVCRFT